MFTRAVKKRTVPREAPINQIIFFFLFGVAA
jgi:hypothetical protein